jgi:hypothetical protein
MEDNGRPGSSNCGGGRGLFSKLKRAVDNAAGEPSGASSARRSRRHRPTAQAAPPRAALMHPAANRPPPAHTLYHHKPPRAPTNPPPAAAISHAVHDGVGAAPGGAGRPAALADPFSHPGTLMGAREIALMRHRVAAGDLPWADAAVALSCQTPRDYRCVRACLSWGVSPPWPLSVGGSPFCIVPAAGAVQPRRSLTSVARPPPHPPAPRPNPLVHVRIDYNGVGQGHDELVEKDGKMVYMQAVMWIATGDDQVRDCPWANERV